MSLKPVSRLVVLPGVLDDPPGPAPVAAVQRLLAGHVQAPHLLSQSRHRAVLASESATEAARAARSARDAELAHELAVRECDRRERWRAHFGTAAIALGALAVVCGTSAVTVLWVLTTTGHLAFRVAAAVALGLILAGTYIAAARVTEYAENWHCARLRRASGRAARYRRAAAAVAARDAAAADAALAAWESLVVEECQLAHPGEAVSQTWLDDCLRVARKIATPE